MAVRYYDRSKETPVEAPQKQFDLTGPTQWLKGEQAKLAMPADRVPPATGKRHYISKELAAELTKGFLTKVSQIAYDFFSSEMPPKYDLAREHGVHLVDSLAHLGYCNFASIVMRKPDGNPYVVRLHFANFNARIDPTPGSKFFNSKSLNRGAMFFGVAFCQDENARGSLKIDRSLFHSGICFITHEPSKALQNAIVLRTGVRVEEWRRLAAQKAAGKRAA
ncbi:hypothetical protein GOB57_23880 [Sinorhizobium meliloti]|nr:hypothetical protein [Sinorhizobium meliloti]